MQQYHCDVLIVGGGLAGITTALELQGSAKSVLLLDRDEEAVFGGLAKESFGGMFFVDSPEQRRLGLRDSTDTNENGQVVAGLKGAWKGFDWDAAAFYSRGTSNYALNEGFQV